MPLCDVLLCLLLPTAFLAAATPIINGVSIPPGSSATISFTWGAYQREALVHMPSGYAPSVPMPVVVVLHGGGGSPANIATQSDWDTTSDSVGALVLYPAGLALDATGVDAPSIQLRYWANDRGTRPDVFGVDDVGFIGAAVDLVAQDVLIDRGQVFAMGISNGGSMVHRLGRDDARRWRALASVSGSYTATPTSAFTPVLPVPMLTMHGTSDSIMPYAGGTTLGQGGPVLSAADTALQWRQANSTAATPVVTAMPDLAADGCTSSLSLWSGSAPGTTVGFITIIGGSHSWPGSPVPGSGSGAGTLTQDFSATEVAWTFFQTYRRPNQPPVLAAPTAAPANILLP